MHAHCNCQLFIIICLHHGREKLVVVKLSIRQTKLPNTIIYVPLIVSLVKLFQLNHIDSMLLLNNYVWFIAWELCNIVELTVHVMKCIFIAPFQLDTLQAMYEPISVKQSNLSGPFSCIKYKKYILTWYNIIWKNSVGFHSRGKLT